MIDPVRFGVIGAGSFIATRAVMPAIEASDRCELVATASRSGAEHRNADLAAPGAADELVAWSRPAAIVHLAGGVAADPSELYRRNALATVHLMRAAGRRRVVAAVAALSTTTPEPRAWTVRRVVVRHGTLGRDAATPQDLRGPFPARQDPWPPAPFATLRERPQVRTARQRLEAARRGV